MAIFSNIESQDSEYDEWSEAVAGGGSSDYYHIWTRVL